MCSDYEKIQKRVSGLAAQVWNFEPLYRTPFTKIGDWQFAFSETTIIYQGSIGTFAFLSGKMAKLL